MLRTGARVGIQRRSRLTRTGMSPQRALLGFVVGGLLVVLGGLWPASAGAVFPGSNGLLTYDAAGSGGQVGVWTAGANGSGATEVASEPNAAVDDPAFSPDGRRIAFVTGSGHIAVMDANGQNVKDLTPGDAPGGVVDGSPSWSPDGSKIAFTRVDYSSAQPEFDVWVMSASDGSGQTDLTPGMGVDSTEPAWSPAGTEIAFVRGNPEEIWTMDASGRNPTQVSHTDFDASDPSWSPDAAKIVYSFEHTDLFVINSDGSGDATQLTNSSGVSEGASSWSPDGTEIVTSGQNKDTSVNNLYLVNPTTGAETKIPNTTTADHPDWQSLPIPHASTGGALDVSLTSASVLGTVDGLGQSVFYYFQYGAANSGKYGSQTAARPALAAGGPTDEAADLTGLTPGTVYDYRIVVQSLQGAVLAVGLNRSFTTLSSGDGSEGGGPPVQIGTLAIGGGTIPLDSANLSTQAQRNIHGQLSAAQVKLAAAGVLTSGGLGVIDGLVTGKHYSTATLKLFTPGTTKSAVTIGLSQVYPTSTSMSSTAAQNLLSADLVVHGSNPTVTVTARDAATSSVRRMLRGRQRISYRKLGRLIHAFRRAARTHTRHRASSAASQALSVRVGHATVPLTGFHFVLQRPLDPGTGLPTGKVHTTGFSLTFPNVGGVSRELARTVSGAAISQVTVLLPAVQGQTSVKVTLQHVVASSDFINAPSELLSLTAHTFGMTGVHSVTF